MSALTRLTQTSRYQSLALCIYQSDMSGTDKCVDFFYVQSRALQSIIVFPLLQSRFTIAYDTPLERLAISGLERTVYR